MLDNPITSTPGPPRHSLRQSLLRKTFHREEVCNDDDAERSSLVASERVATSTPASTGSRDQSISLTPQKEHYQGCLKLFAENKITKNNAWSLQLIDFMTSMLRRRDQRMSNLQTASTVMDASARIYSLRVDGVHHDALLMAGGLTKVAQSKRGKKDDDNAEDDGAAEQDVAPLANKKKKRMKGATAANPDVFNGDFETNLCIDPFFERLAATTGDVTSSNRAFNASLPLQRRTLALVLRTDLKFVEWGEEEQEGGAEGGGAAAGGARVALPARLLPAFSAQDRVCVPFTGFSISEWDPSAEDGAGAALDLSQQAVAFDVEADVEPVPDTETHDLYEEEPLGGIESSEEGDVAVAACVARAAAPAPARLASMQPGAPRDARLEYSYCAVRAWAGPAHWRLKHNRASKASERSQPPGADAPRRAARARRSLQFLTAGLAAGGAPPPDYEPAPPARIMISRKTLATGPAWNENNYRTPVDRGLDESFFRSLSLRRRGRLPRRSPAPAPEPARLAADEARPYDYENEHDASYCPLNMEDGSAWALAGAPEAGAGAPRAQLADGVGELLEPPTKIAKIFIPYALRAKRVDMKQMKREAWHALAEGGARSLGGVLGALGRRLGGEARAALTVPLALQAVLHLANERGLALRSRPGLRDLDIELRETRGPACGTSLPRGSDVRPPRAGGDRGAE